jgi:carboxypeptidase Q
VRHILRRRQSSRLLGAALLAALAAAASAAFDGNWLEAYRDTARRLIEAARADRFAWNRLAELSDTFGHRLSGSPALEAALRWAEAEMRKDGLANVRREKVVVPRWVRGRESAEIVEPFPSALVMLGLGGSVGTPPEGVTARVLSVASFEDLDKRAAEARGAIVLYNVPYTNYGETVRYRRLGASHAARHGALGVLLRSVGPIGLRTPHTGSLQYDETAPRIPAAAISVEDAQRLQRITDRGQRLVVRLAMQAQALPDVESANLVGEIPGRERPEEVVLVGGHFDSWDVGSGALDDGGGCIVTWEALRLVKKLGLRPRRTLRVVLFTNEENGLRGAHAYRDQHESALAQHVLALESDNGAFRPRGFNFTGSERARATVQEIASLLAPIGADRIGPSGGGADVNPLAQAAHVPTMSPDVDNSRYFIYHHTPADTPERLDPEEMSLLAGAIAVMAFVVADMPARLGH